MNLVVVVALTRELADVQLSYPFEVTGVGKVNAALGTLRAIDRHRPDLVVNFGSAGGVHGPTGRLVEVSEVVQRDADCEPLAPRGTLLDDVSRFASGHAGVRCGSGDSFVRAAEPWMHAHCDVVDMELWGVVKACVERRVAWRSLKWISDAADENAAEHWQENAHRGAHAFEAWLRALKPGRAATP